MLIASGASQLNELSEYYSSMGKKEEDGDKTEIDKAEEILEQAGIAESEQIGDKIQNMIDKAGQTDNIEVQVTQHYVCLNMKGALLFESASATLTNDAVTVLEQVARILKLYEDNLIEIEGHTDNIPVSYTHLTLPTT